MEPDIQCEPDGLIKIFNKKETADIEEQWMKTFCKKKLGLNTKAYKWHIFSGGGFPARDGCEARHEYESKIETKYIVMGNNHELAILTSKKPLSCDLSDYYVFPVNMAWTMAFTHEEGWLGPYFAYHPKHIVLERENEKRREKERQKEIARKKGWWK